MRELVRVWRLRSHFVVELDRNMLPGDSMEYFKRGNNNGKWCLCVVQGSACCWRLSVLPYLH